MTQRLPISGEDDGTWGGILNGFLEVSHNPDGSLQVDAVVATGAITTVNGKTTSDGVITLGEGDIANLSADLSGKLGAANNLSDVASASSSRVHLGLGTAATEDIDTTAGDIAPLGAQAAGSVGLVADAGHVHEMPTLNEVNAPTGPVDLGSQKISHLAPGVSASDGATLGQVGPDDWQNVVTGYDADPTGVVDSTTAVQNALTAAVGGTVYFPVGTYKISATLNPPSSGGNTIGTTMRGAGWGSVLEFDQSVVSTMIAMGGTTQAKVDIRDLRIEQMGAADGGTAINANYFVSSVIDNVSIDRGSGNKHCNVGISMDVIGTYYNVVKNSRVSVDGAGAIGISMSNVSNSNTIADVKIVVNGSGGVGSSGIYIDAHSNTISHCDIETAPGNGVFVDSAGHATTLINPYLEANNIGLKLAASVYCPTVVGGTIESNITANIQDNGSVNPIITNAWENSGSSVISNLLTTTALPLPVGLTNGGTGVNAASNVALLTSLGAAGLASPTFTGSLVAPVVSASGLTGATSASRYVGATTGGAPASGTFVAGDFCVDQTGDIWVCTLAGTPGTWVPLGPVPNLRLPADIGLIAWSYDPVACSNSSASINGSLYLARLPLRSAKTITNLAVFLSAGATTATASENFLALIDSTGTIRGSTAAGAIDTQTQSSGWLSHAMSSTYAAPAGQYWVAVLLNAATPATFARGTGSSLTGPNGGLAGSNTSFCTNGTLLSALPGSIATASNTLTGAISICVGVS